MKTNCSTQKKSYSQNSPELDPEKSIFVCINPKKKTFETVQDSFLHPSFVFFIHHASAENFMHSAVTLRTLGAKNFVQGTTNGTLSAFDMN